MPAALGIEGGLEPRDRKRMCLFVYWARVKKVIMPIFVRRGLCTFFVIGPNLWLLHLRLADPNLTSVILRNTQAKCVLIKVKVTVSGKPQVSTVSVRLTSTATNILPALVHLCVCSSDLWPSIYLDSLCHHCFPWSPKVSLLPDRMPNQIILPGVTSSSSQSCWHHEAKHWKQNAHWLTIQCVKGWKPFTSLLLWCSLHSNVYPPSCCKAALSNMFFTIFMCEYANLC